MSERPHSWITREVLQEFFAERKVSMACELCGSEMLSTIDSGADEEIASSTAYLRQIDGTFRIDKSKHIPVARVMCNWCGNLRLHSLYALDAWRAVKEAQAEAVRMSRSNKTPTTQTGAAEDEQRS